MKITKMTARVLMTFAALLAGLSLPAAAAETYHLRGDRAWLSFYGVEADGCTYHGGYIDIGEEVVQNGGAAPEAPARITVSAYRFSECGEESQYLFQVYGSAELPANAFKLQGNLQGATLSATVDLFDQVSGTAVPVALNLAWTGEGVVTTGSYRVRYHNPDYHYRSSSTGRYRDAQLSGSVVVQGFNLLPSEYTDASLSSVNQGSVTRQGF